MKQQGGDQLVPVVLAWYFFILSIIQVRFAGQFGLFVALFGGMGFITLGEAVDLLKEAEDQDKTQMTQQNKNSSNIRDVNLLGRRKLLTLSGLFAFVWLPGAVLSGGKMSQVMISQEAFNTARAVKAHAEARGYSYPENYVWVTWDRSRMFNTFVNGQADSVEFAHSYDEFLRSERPQDWYSRMDERVGYVVVERQSGEFSSEDARTYARLFKRHGGQNETVSGLGRFRLIHISEESEYKAFSYVPGAVITGQVGPQETVAVETEVTVSGQSFSYQRQIQADESGRFRVRVSYAGQYTVLDKTVAVSETAVTQGAEVSVS
jgi:dolichyl-diphosphooligosaccharide--protein glycosyltransferase